MFELITDPLSVARRSHVLGGGLSIDPNAANPIIQGEFLEKVGGVSDDTATRGAGTPGTVPAWAVFTERGRTDTQALGKVSLLYGGFYEADTDVMAATGITLGETLEVSNVTVGGLTRRGLVQFTSGRVIGFCTRLPADNGGLLRFAWTLS